MSRGSGGGLKYFEVEYASSFRNDPMELGTQKITTSGGGTPSEGHSKVRVLLLDNCS
jgi:hypothetical protein